MFVPVLEIKCFDLGMCLCLRAVIPGRMLTCVFVRFALIEMRGAGSERGHA